MQTRTFVIDKEGLRSHEAALLVQTACKYPCRIELEHGQKKVNAKSMMGALSLGMMSGEQSAVHGGRRARKRGARRY